MRHAAVQLLPAAVAMSSATGLATVPHQAAAHQAAEVVKHAAAAAAALEAVEKMVILLPASWLARVRSRAARMAVMLHV